MGYKKMSGQDLAAAIGVAPPTLSEAARQDYQLRGRFRPAQWAQRSESGRLIAYQVPEDALKTMRNGPNTARIVDSGASSASSASRKNAGTKDKEDNDRQGEPGDHPLWLRALGLGVGFAALALWQSQMEQEARSIFGGNEEESGLQSRKTDNEIRQEMWELAAPLLD